MRFSFGIALQGDSLVADDGYLTYDWYLADTLVGTTTEPWWLAGYTGTYYVIATGADDCPRLSNTVDVQLTDCISKGEPIRAEVGQLGCVCLERVKTVRVPALMKSQFDFLGTVGSCNHGRSFRRRNCSVLLFMETGEDLYGWDGLIDGRPAENGNYIIVIKATTFQGLEVNYNGPITLLK